MRPTLLVLVLAGCGSAASPTANEAPSSTALSWLVGCWQNVDENGVTSYEAWRADGDALVGENRTTRADDKGGVEVLHSEALRIDRTDASFKAIEVESSKVVFHNPVHDFPQRIIYTLQSASTLAARIEGSDKGKPKSSSWSWNRVECQ